MVGGRWVRDQAAHIMRLSDDVYKISWDEPTGTCVSTSFNIKDKIMHGVIFFPRWVAQDPKKTVCFQNEFIARMVAYRDAGPTYPKLVIDEYAPISFMEDCGAANETVIDFPPEKLPAGYADRRH